MKKIVITLLCLMTLNSFASTDSMIMMLGHRDIVELEQDMSKEFFKLSKVEDVYNTKGVRPRCPCNSYKLTFTRHLNNKKMTKTMDVSVNGFGSNLVVTIKKK